LSFKGLSLKVFESFNLSKNVSKCELLFMFSLSRIVTKLVNNAYKYTPAEGIITVLARVEKSAFSISSLPVKVSNTGV
jgi:signal transduction histidine kinase